MRRSELKRKYLKNKSDESLKAFKKQKNYTNRLAKRERSKYFANLDLNKYTDNIKIETVATILFMKMFSKTILHISGKYKVIPLQLEDGKSYTIV